MPLPKPVRRLIDRCETGFTIGKKLKLTLISLVYLISPLDLIPDLLIPFGIADDGILLLLLVKIWCSPTIASNTLEQQNDIIDAVPADAVPVRNTARGTTR